MGKIQERLHDVDGNGAVWGGVGNFQVKLSDIRGLTKTGSWKSTGCVLCD